MINRDEFNKILSLLDAGILSSDFSLKNQFDSIQPIDGIEEFSYLNSSIENINHTIDTNLLEVEAYIANINNILALRIGKNNYTISWELSFIRANIVIEDNLIDSFNFAPKSLKTLDEINTHINSSMIILKNIINNPRDTMNTSSNILKFNTSLYTIEDYKAKASTLEYSELTKSIKFDLIYSINIITNKVV